MTNYADADFAHWVGGGTDLRTGSTPTSRREELLVAMTDGGLTTNDLLSPTPGVIGHMWARRAQAGVANYLAWASQFGFPFLLGADNTKACCSGSCRQSARST